MGQFGPVGRNHANNRPISAMALAVLGPECRIAAPLRRCCGAQAPLGRYARCSCAARAPLGRLRTLLAAKAPRRRSRVCRCQRASTSTRKPPAQRLKALKGVAGDGGSRPTKLVAGGVSGARRGGRGDARAVPWGRASSVGRSIARFPSSLTWGTPSLSCASRRRLYSFGQAPRNLPRHDPCGPLSARRAPGSPTRCRPWTRFTLPAVVKASCRPYRRRLRPPAPC